MDGHIAPDRIAPGNGGEYTEHFPGKRVKKSALCIISPVGHSRVKILHIDFLVRGRLIGGIDDHPSGGVDDPDVRMQIGGQSLHLTLYGFQGNIGIIQVGRVGPGDLCGLLIQISGNSPAYVFCRQRGADRSNRYKAEKTKNNICENKFKIQCFTHG